MLIIVVVLMDFMAIKSINTTTIISTDVPPTEIVGEIPAKLMSANGNKQIRVK